MNSAPLRCAPPKALATSKARVGAGLFVLMSLTAAGCESNDPCFNRTAACLNVVIRGEADPVYYTGMTVRVYKGTSQTELLPASSMAELRATAKASVQTIVTFQLPDDFNGQPDWFMKNDDGVPDARVAAIDNLPGEAEKIAALKALRAQDPRYVHISVVGTKVGGQGGPVEWDSVKEEDSCYSPSQWLQQKYYRVGKNQFAAAYALLLPPAAAGVCPPVK